MVHHMQPTEFVIQYSGVRGLSSRDYIYNISQHGQTVEWDELMILTNH